MTAPLILILGGASAIAHAYARLCAADGKRIVLAGRNIDRLAAAASDLTARGAVSADIHLVDFAQLDTLAAAALDLRLKFGAPDEILLAYGALDAPAVHDHLHQARAVMEINYTSPALMLLALLAQRDPAKKLRVVTIGSVAGDRGRGSNFVYGSAKGGLEIFIEGLYHKLDEHGVSFTIVKPGFVDTPMTAEYVKAGLLWSSPERIAECMTKAVASGKRVSYVPWFWLPIMTVIRLMPWFLFMRLRI